MTNIELNLIGVGYNVPQISLVNIAGIVPSGSVAFASPKSLALYENGEIEPLLTMHIFTEGYASLTWLFGFLFYEQYTYLSSTYCNNGLSGEVTISSYFGSISPTRKNAILTLPTPKQLQSEYRYKQVPVLFTKLAAAS
jgi:hypothetical protein